MIAFPDTTWAAPSYHTGPHRFAYEFTRPPHDARRCGAGGLGRGSSPGYPLTSRPCRHGSLAETPRRPWRPSHLALHPAPIIAPWRRARLPRAWAVTLLARR